VSAAAIEANDFAAPSVAGTNRWLIAIVVALASFMEVLDTTIANVALPYMAAPSVMSQAKA
jgi:MFS transporter, DHA2 family, multidrug resistance protein